MASDALIAIVLATAAIGRLWGDSSTSFHKHANALTTILSALAALPLVWRRPNPIAVLAVVAPSAFLLEALGVDGPGGLAAVIAIYTLAAHTNGNQRAIAAKLLAVGGVATLTVGYAIHNIAVGNLISAVLLSIGAFILGDNMQRRRLHFADLAERAERHDRERELMARQRVHDERSRIARELHDVVAHSVSLMIIQAGAARRSINTAPLQAESALRELESTGRQAMDELRRVLGVMRTGDDVQGLAPQPSLDSVRLLIENDPSLPVELDEIGTPPDEVPSSVGLSMYRVVQEALTNVRKHAGQVRKVNVDLIYGPDNVVVQITDDGRGASVANNADGHGLVGMRERMALCGGTVTAGPRVGGGWQVRATAPLAEVGA